MRISKQAQITEADLGLLGDCFYLPYESGPQAEKFFDGLEKLLSKNPDRWGVAFLRFNHFIERMTGLYSRFEAIPDRALWATLQQYLWDLREEATFVRDYLRWLGNGGKSEGRPFQSPNYPFPLYRGGFIGTLRQLLEMGGSGLRQGRRGNGKRGGHLTPQLRVE